MGIDRHIEGICQCIGYLSDDASPSAMVHRYCLRHVRRLTLNCSGLAFPLRLVVLTVPWRAPLDSDAISCSARAYLPSTSFWCLSRACTDPGSLLPRRIRSCGDIQTSPLFVASLESSSPASSNSEARQSGVSKRGSCVSGHRDDMAVVVGR